MKKVVVLSLLFVVALSFTSCKSEKSKKEETPSTQKKEQTKAYSLKSAKNEINFVAYKTTDKVPVGGQFKKVNIISGGEGNTIKEAISNAEFSIPVSSLFTNNTSRDYKIKKFFFGIMDNTKLLSGKFMIENDTNGYVSLTMNGVTDKIPFTYSIEAKSFSMKAAMDINKWNAVKALNSLNTVCKDLHKGADGVSKTWSEVVLNIKTTF